MDGSQRVRATSVLPRYGPPPYLFKGHLSTKSNAFCTDSSSLRLSTLQLVKNHMAVHYNKILSAKAAVDCSIPISVTTSIKYADQQRREKLKKELAQYEKEFKLTKAALQTNSKNNSKSFFNTISKPSGEPQDQNVLIEEMNGSPSFEQSLVPSSEGLHLSLPKSDKSLMNGVENSRSSPSCIDYVASSPRKPCSGNMYGRRPRSTFPNSHRFQLVISKAPSRDLLDKHSELFSNKQLPFTPRTLKTEAKSFLSQYRYYTPAKRKKNFTEQRMEAETQTELSSFNSDFDIIETKNLTDSKVNTKQASNYMTYSTKEETTPLLLQGNDLRWHTVKDGTLQPSSQRTACQYTMKLPSENKTYSNDEELSYLSFIEDVTDEILKLGLFSNRFLERLFERHIEQNKQHLDEGKMRHLLHSLKIDLGCTSEDNSVQLKNGNMLNFLRTVNSEQNELKNENVSVIQQENQQYRKALDMLSSAPKDEKEMFSLSGEFFLPIYKSKYSEGVIIQQVNDETNLKPSSCDENNPSISDDLINQETSVCVIEGDSDTEKVDSDTEKVDASDELCCLSTSRSQPVQFSSVRGNRNHDKELSVLKIMEMSIEDFSSNV
ncbi:spermatogenesis-associated protein 7 isoform X2 [Marmota monax]|uniref:spermatogenesis-associated protein 7 isoform X2 n=2 Tax=Marmota monax TaxID=9995 RepID=UPI001EB05226|nr:spermatogenesis-associated protein 7 isoform X2 [Marmota monax]KAI6055563.1 SPATA7 [Marmota monax]KAI6068638.1 SPATA7 [Marmota monax]